jgi:hypothetical protein
VGWACSRELLGSAALPALGVPSVRALAVVGSDDERDCILRDEWYTGRASCERPGVLVCVHGLPTDAPAAAIRLHRFLHLCGMF